MPTIAPIKRTTAGLLVVLLAAASLAHADSWEDKFYRAFYLETAQGDVAGAAELYRQISTAEQADAKLRAQAETRRQACQEELASADFTRLMPPDTLVYAELNRPGEKLLGLIEALGLLAPDEHPTVERQQRFAISPVLVNAFLDVRGVAVAMTGFDPINQKPVGVAVFHPGNLELVRGLLETALPVTSEPAKPIGGYPTYKVEDEVLVTLTKRLVVVSPQRGLIVNVIRRLNGESDRSLATSEALAEVLKDREGALLFFCVNAKPIMPLLNAAMAAGGTQSRELATAQAVLDLNSIHSLTGRADLSGEGISLDITLRLDEGHHNLVYNLLRMPPLDRETLRCVPQGAAGFLAMALNEAGAGPAAVPVQETEKPAVVTGLDFGREIFANIVGLAVYALPPSGATAASGPPIPDLAAVITVRDPSKSEALWTQMLGVASLAAGARAIEGTPVEIEGTEVRSYAFPDGVTIYFATLDNAVLVSPSQSAMARSLAARRSAKSILEDPTFAASLSRLGPDSTIAMFAHAGRCVEIAKQFAPPQDVAELEPWLGVLDETVASLVVTHSGEVFRFSAMVSGMPDVGDLVTQLILDQRQKQQARQAAAKQRREQRQQLSVLMRTQRWDEALEQVDTLLAAPDSPALNLLLEKFRILAVGQEDRAGALAVGELILKKAHNAERTLNNFAWALLTEEQYQDQFDELALRLSERSNEITGHQVWQYVDTLAWAKFKTGDIQAALELEKKALALCDDEGETGELKKALARFKDALNQGSKRAG